MEFHSYGAHNLRHRVTAPGFVAYELRKAAWMKEHPEALPREYTVAIRRIAKECGI